MFSIKKLFDEAAFDELKPVTVRRSNRVTVTSPRFRFLIAAQALVEAVQHLGNEYYDGMWLARNALCTWRMIECSRDSYDMDFVDRFAKRHHLCELPEQDLIAATEMLCKCCWHFNMAFMHHDRIRSEMAGVTACAIDVALKLYRQRQLGPARKCENEGSLTRTAG